VKTLFVKKFELLLQLLHLTLTGENIKRGFLRITKITFYKKKLKKNLK